MGNLLKSLSSLLLGLSFIAVGNGLLNILVPIKTTQLGFGPFLVGLFTTFYYIGFLLGCYRGPRIIKKVGHIRSFTCFAALLSTSALCFSFYLPTGLWLVLRTAAGFSIATIYMITESWINEFANNSNRGKIISIYRIVDLSSLVLGQLLLGAFTVDDSTGFIVAGTLINMGLVPVALTSASSPKPLDNIEIHFRKIFKISPIAFITAGIVGAANGSFYALGPQLALVKGFSTVLISIFMSSAILAGVLCQVAVGWAADKMDRERLLYLVALFAGLVGFLVYIVGNASNGQILLIFLAFCWGACAMPLYSLAIAIANDRANDNEFLHVSGGLLIIFSLGAVVGPFITPLFIWLHGPAGLFFFTAVVHFSPASYVFYRRRFVVEPIAESDREKFISAPRTTPVILESDPRSRL